MATRTVATAAPSRPQDYLYDTTYTAGDVRDVFRNMQKNQRPQVERVPVYQNMFADSAMHPSFGYRLKGEGAAIPSQDQLSTMVGGKASRGVQAITGRDRYKYFKRPLMPYLKGVPPEAVLAKAPPARLRREGDEMEQKDRYFAEEFVPRSRDVAIQSDYRESETQTDPFTPDYVVNENENGEQPEVLALASLTYGEGLPVGKDEIELIDKIRRRQMIEANLPPLAGEKWQLDQRMETLKELELMEWSEREDQMKRLQEEKLRLVERAYLEREKQREMMNMKKIEEVRDRARKAAQEQVSKIRNRRMRGLRKLGRQREAEYRLSQKGRKRDIVDEYVNPGSDIFVPSKRKGVRLDKDGVRFETSSYFTETLGGILELERAVAPKALPRKVPPLGLKLSTAPIQKLDVALDVVETMVRKSTSKEEVEKVDVRDLYKATPRVVRPATPTLEDEVNDDEEISIILLQRLLRGRSGQNMMFEGKEKRLDLIKELVAVEDVKNAERERSKEIAEEDYKIATEDAVGRVTDALQGEMVGQSLDYLSKELLRRKQEKLVCSLEAEAKAERRRREEAETARREAEITSRKREDEEYKRLMRANLQSSFTFVEEVMERTVDECSLEQAKTEVEIKDVAVESAVMSLEDNEDVSLLTQEIMTSFVLPEVQRQEAFNEKRLQEHKFLRAAHEETYSAVQNVEKE